MSDLQPDRPEIITHRIPAIEVYQVTDDELQRIEETYGSVGQDLTFAVAALSVGVTLATTLFAGTFGQTIFVTFVMAALFCAFVTVYTGVRWLRSRRITPDAIAKIRRRRVDPAPPSSGM